MNQFNNKSIGLLFLNKRKTSFNKFTTQFYLKSIYFNLNVPVKTNLQSVKDLNKF
jgi:hypothetical protein